jgi:hypothetical protein
MAYYYDLHGLMNPEIAGPWFEKIGPLDPIQKFPHTQ